MKVCLHSGKAKPISLQFDDFFLTKFNILISRTCLYTLRKLLHLYLYYTSPVFPGKPGILLSAF